MLSRISSSTPSASQAPFSYNVSTTPSGNELGTDYDEIWPYTVQSTILFVLFIIWMVIGVFVGREVILVFLDHRKRKRKPTLRKRSYNGAYSVKKKRYVNDKNYQPVANGGNEIV
ncbi:unnamed protein product [Caenorhabditis brenneri]